MDKAPGAFRTISEVADLLETPSHVLRFWESRFPQIKPVKRAGGRRYYRPADVALLSGIRHLLHAEGMTIRGVQKVLRDQGVRYVAGLSGDLADADLDGADMADIDLADTDLADLAALDRTEPDAATPPQADVVPLDRLPRRMTDQSLTPTANPTATTVQPLYPGPARRLPAWLWETRVALWLRLGWQLG